MLLVREGHFGYRIEKGRKGTLRYRKTKLRSIFFETAKLEYKDVAEMRALCGGKRIYKYSKKNNC
jgi:hypothetical protein